jgi:hypothetical protein
MAEPRLGRILATIGDGVGGRESLDRLSRATARELEVSAVGFALVLGGQHRGTLGVSDARAAEVEDLQFTLGEGPCLEANRSGQPIFEPDLATSERFPAFGPGAAALGLAAALAVPLHVGATQFGSLDLYRTDVGLLDDGVLDDAVIVADVATVRVMGFQAELPPGSLTVLLDEVSESRAVVHQATGVVAVQLDIGLDEALVALRARAFADERPVSEVAADVVGRRMRFDR